MTAVGEFDGELLCEVHRRMVAGVVLGEAGPNSCKQQSAAFEVGPEAADWANRSRGIDVRLREKIMTYPAHVGNPAIARELLVSEPTVRKYRKMAKQPQVAVRREELSVDEMRSRLEDRGFVVMEKNGAIKPVIVAGSVVGVEVTNEGSGVPFSDKSDGVKDVCRGDLGQASVAQPSAQGNVADARWPHVKVDRCFVPLGSHSWPVPLSEHYDQVIADLRGKITLLQELLDVLAQLRHGL